MDALNAADAAGKIPHIPQSSAPGGQSNPVYPAGVNPSSPEICSATYKCRIAEDIWDAPDGVFASSFDDGPYPVSSMLNVPISCPNSSRISDLSSPHRVLAVQRRHDDPFHDWSPYPQQPAGVRASIRRWARHRGAHLQPLVHDDFEQPGRRCTSECDALPILDVSDHILVQLGWTMQIIHESTGGRVPRYWRPPYGDSDHRVRAIAKEVCPSFQDVKMSLCHILTVTVTGLRLRNRYLEL